MVTNPAPTFLTEEEYLRFEETSPIKHEYVDGEVYAMAGAKDGHVTAAGNIFALLRNHVRGTGCRVFMSDMKLRVAKHSSYFYPDVMVTCDVRDRDQVNYKSYPSVVFEVLSDSTEAYDRGEKFYVYQPIETLQEYVIVSTRYPRVECFRRNDQGLWVLQTYELGTSFELASLNWRILLNDIFEDVAFDPGNVSSL